MTFVVLKGGGETPLLNFQAELSCKPCPQCGGSLRADCITFQTSAWKSIQVFNLLLLANYFHFDGDTFPLPIFSFFLLTNSHVWKADCGKSIFYHDRNKAINGCLKGQEARYGFLPLPFIFDVI